MRQWKWKKQKTYAQIQNKRKHLYHLLRSSSYIFSRQKCLVFFFFIHDDMDFDDDWSNLMINYAYAYFLYNHLLYVNVVVDIENEMTLYYPKEKMKTLKFLFDWFHFTYNGWTNIKITWWWWWWKGWIESSCSCSSTSSRICCHHNTCWWWSRCISSTIKHLMKWWWCGIGGKCFRG